MSDNHHYVKSGLLPSAVAAVTSAAMEVEEALAIAEALGVPVDLPLAQQRVSESWNPLLTLADAIREQTERGSE